MKSSVQTSTEPPTIQTRNFYSHIIKASVSHANKILISDEIQYSSRIFYIKSLKKRFRSHIKNLLRRTPIAHLLWDWLIANLIKIYAKKSIFIKRSIK